MRLRVLLPTVALASIAAVALADAASSKVVAIDAITAQGVGAKIGTVALQDSTGGLVMKINLKGLAPGQHGFHLHANGSCAPAEQDGQMAAGMAAGGHFDPDKTGKHLGPLAEGGHKGDLPALTVAADGTAKETLIAPHLKLADMAGHAIMIHAGGDNYSDRPAPLGGGAGRVACGVIK